jgi:formyltetrahydrofolate synthetase
MAFLQAQGDEEQHQHAQEDVKAMKTGQHEEGRALQTRGEFEVQIVVSMKVFIALNKKENQT